MSYTVRTTLDFEVAGAYDEDEAIAIVADSPGLEPNDTEWEAYKSDGT